MVEINPAKINSRWHATFCNIIKHMKFTGKSTPGRKGRAWEYEDLDGHSFTDGGYSQKQHSSLKKWWPSRFSNMGTADHDV